MSWVGEVRFNETDNIPSDSKQIGTTWFKVNKNGTPDRRFKDNYQIPIVRYGDLVLKTQNGLFEEYQFSNFELSQEFAVTFLNYLQELKKISAISNYKIEPQ